MKSFTIRVRGSISGSDRFRIRDQNRHQARERGAQRGVPGTALCWYGHPVPRRATHNADAGQPSGSAIRDGSSGSEGGRRRAIGGVAALPFFP
jgi:hypothetical protein